MNRLKYTLSTHSKWHYFETARSFYKKKQLSKLITGYPWFLLRKEKIPYGLIDCNGNYTIINKLLKSNKHSYLLNLRDKVQYLNAKSISKKTIKYIDESDVLLAISGTGFIGGSEYVKRGKFYICERSSAHIDYTKEILHNEYKDLKLFSVLDQSLKYYFNDWKSDMERKEYNDADLILTPSTFVSNTFKKFGFTNTLSLNFGINLDKFYPYEEKQSKKTFDILFVGQLSVRKGLHYLINAFKKFDHPNKRLHIVGVETEEIDFFKGLIKFEDNIIFHGIKKDNNLRDMYNFADVFVLPSLEEGFAFVIKEALACGCPVIVSENTGAKEFVQENDCGLVVPIKDSNSITKSLDQLNEDRTLLQKFSENAKVISKNNTWDKYTEELNTHVSKLI